MVYHFIMWMETRSSPKDAFWDQIQEVRIHPAPQCTFDRRDQGRLAQHHHQPGGNGGAGPGETLSRWQSGPQRFPAARNSRPISALQYPDGTGGQGPLETIIQLDPHPPRGPRSTGNTVITTNFQVQTMLADRKATGMRVNPRMKHTPLR